MIKELLEASWLLMLDIIDSPYLFRITLPLYKILLREGKASARSEPEIQKRTR